MAQVGTRILASLSLKYPKRSPPATAPSIVHVTSEPACALVNPRSPEMAASMKPSISMSNPSMLKPITEAASAFHPYAVTNSSATAICALVGEDVRLTGDSFHLPSLSRYNNEVKTEDAD